MKELIEMFGNRTIEELITCILAIVFLAGCYVKIRNYFFKRAIEDEKKDKMVQKALTEISKYPQYRKQSIEIQEQLTGAINRIEEKLEEYSARLEVIEESNKKRELNKLRDRLIQSYRYYTSNDKNPSLCWTKMEAEAFWEMFRDYEELLGDGYLHSVVEPAMRLLTVIEMDDSEKVSKLMSSRK